MNLILILQPGTNKYRIKSNSFFPVPLRGTLSIKFREDVFCRFLYNLVLRDLFSKKNVFFLLRCISILYGMSQK